MVYNRPEMTLQIYSVSWMMQTAGSRQQTAGSRQPTAGSRQQTAGSRH
jgi:hypothetical protein